MKKLISGHKQDTRGRFYCRTQGDGSIVLKGGKFIV